MGFPIFQKHIHTPFIIPLLAQFQLSLSIWAWKKRKWLRSCEPSTKTPFPTFTLNPPKNSRLIAGEPLHWNIYSSEFVYVDAFSANFPNETTSAFPFVLRKTEELKSEEHPSGWWRMGFPIFQGRKYAYCMHIYACTYIYCNKPPKNQPTIPLPPHLLCSMGFGNPRFKDQKDWSNKKHIHQTTRCWHADTQTLFCSFYRSIFFIIT